MLKTTKYDVTLIFKDGTIDVVHEKDFNDIDPYIVGSKTTTKSFALDSLFVGKRIFTKNEGSCIIISIDGDVIKVKHDDKNVLIRKEDILYQRLCNL